jgi:hypothetical protein
MIILRLDEARRRSLPNFACLVYRRWAARVLLISRAVMKIADRARAAFDHGSAD